MDELERWLSAAGLANLAQGLRDNDVDLTVLKSLTEGDLEKIGLSLGNRKRLLRALQQETTAPSTGSPADTRSADPAGSRAPAVPAERRYLTVVFCDLVGSTALSARLDPEELRDILHVYEQAVAQEVLRFGGHVAQYLGDGILAYFGWPHAHEHDAESAVRAGLAAIEAINRISTPLDRPLSARVGIATGLVVVGDNRGHEETAVGETPNLAAALQAAAPPNGVVIEASTRRLLGDLYEYEALEPIKAKGFTHPVQAYKVVRQSKVQSRFEAFHPAALTPLVGRDDELDLLLRRWEKAKGGVGQVVLVAGEPGIGKSRLTAAFMERIASEPHVKLRHFCSPHHRDSALFPIASQLERAASLERDDSTDVKLKKIAALLGEGEAASEDRRLIAGLLGLPEVERPSAPALNPQQRKQKTFDTLLRQLDELAAQQPVLHVFEDAQWIDPSSQELLDRTIERIRQRRVMLLVTYRPEFVPPWTGQPSVSLIALSRLDRQDNAALVAKVAGDGRLSPETINEIVARTDGVPLFAEELTKAILEAGSNSEKAARTLASMPLNTVPATLHASLMARLDRLGQAKEVAQVAAAIGRECSHKVLAEVSQLPRSVLAASLEQLILSGLLIARGTPPDALYMFKHALVQDAAYGTLLISRRQSLHARIAEVLETHFAEQVAREPELLARHFAESRQFERAATYWIKAGRQAAERSANLEAIGQLSRALDTLMLLPESAERDRLELVAQTSIGTPLMSVHGYAAEEMGAAYGRARVLSQRLGDQSGIYATLSGEFSYHFVRGNHLMMRKLVQEARSISAASGDESLRLVACRFAGLSSLHAGAFEEARAELETILGQYDPDKHRPPPDQYVHDPKAYALGYLALILWIQGYLEQARDCSQAALRYTAELNHANMTGFARVYAGAGLHELLRDAEQVRAHVQSVLELAEQHSLHYFRLSAVILRGWLMAMDGDPAAGVELMQRNIEERFALGAGWYQTRYLCMLAEICLAGHEHAEGLRVIARARQHMELHDEHMWEAEAQRLEGELLRLAGDDGVRAEACLVDALSTARRQGARSLELRAATSLARFRGERGQAESACRELEAVLGWFTEGLETADVREACSLLDSLRSEARR